MEAKAAKAQAKKEAAAAKEQAEKDIKAATARATAQAKKEAAAATAQAKKEAAAEVAQAKKEAKKAAQSEHNTEFRAPPTTPEKNPRAKAKTGPSPKKPPPVPPFPTGERASGSQDNPEYTHEPKGKAGRPKNTQANTQANAKAKSKGPDIKVDTKTKPEQPNHDTDRDVSRNKQYWRLQGIGYMRDQLTKRGFRETRKPDGNKILRADYLGEILRRIDAGTWA